MDPSQVPTRELAEVLYAAPRACGEAPELFFPPEGEEEPADRWARESAASVICADCPVREVCLEWALRTEVTASEGIWAGYTAVELAAVRRDSRHGAARSGPLVRNKQAAAPGDSRQSTPPGACSHRMKEHVPASHTAGS